MGTLEEVGKVTKVEDKISPVERKCAEKVQRGAHQKNQGNGIVR